MIYSNNDLLFIYPNSERKLASSKIKLMTLHRCHHSSKHAIQQGKKKYVKK